MNEYRESNKITTHRVNNNLIIAKNDSNSIRTNEFQIVDRKDGKVLNISYSEAEELAKALVESGCIKNLNGLQKAVTEAVNKKKFKEMLENIKSKFKELNLDMKAVNEYKSVFTDEDDRVYELINLARDIFDNDDVGHYCDYKEGVRKFTVNISRIERLVFYNKDSSLCVDVNIEHYRVRENECGNWEISFVDSNNQEMFKRILFGRNFEDATYNALKSLGFPYEMYDQESMKYGELQIKHKKLT